MVFAAELSKELADLSQDAVSLHRELLANFNLPLTYSKSRWNSLSVLLMQDKKVKQSRLRFIGINRIGRPVWLEDVSLSILAKVYERISK